MNPSTRVLKEVDPNLNIISGNHRKHKARMDNGHIPMFVDEWNKAGGAICPRCKQEAVRFRPQDGVCIKCARMLNEQIVRKENRLRKSMKFIKAHNARITKKKSN